MGWFRAGSAGAVAALTAGLAAVGAVVTAAPSYADDTVTVQGTAFPDPAHANLSFVGCADLYQRTDEPLVPMIGVGPGAAPSGVRSLGFDLAGGNAVGALFTVDSMLKATTASLAVNSVGRATGVAYAGYQEPADSGTALLWIGRSELVTPGGAWQTVDAATRTYTWTKYDMSTRQPVADGSGVPTTVSGFADTHGGDGPGVYTIGFGCNGTAFSMDRMQVGPAGDVTTYDIEGLRTMVTIGAGSHDGVVGRVAEGDPVTITGDLRTDTGDPVPHATLILEQRKADSKRWTQVLVADVVHGSARATVKPDGKTFYRWRFVDRPLAEGSSSMPLVLDLLPPSPTDSPSPTGRPTPTHEPPSTPSPSGSPTPTDQPGPSDPATSTPATESATHSATQSASDSATASSSADPTDEPSDHGSPSSASSVSSSPRHR